MGAEECAPAPALHMLLVSRRAGSQGAAPREKAVWGHAAHGDVLSVTDCMVTHCSSLPGPCC